MKITDAQVIICSPGRNFVTLKLITEDKLYGLGDATLNGRESAVASYLTDHVLPLLIGRDARKIEDIWQYLYKGAYWRRGPVTVSAIWRRCASGISRKSKSPRYAALSDYRGCIPRCGAGIRPCERWKYGRNGHGLCGISDATGYKAYRAQSGIPGPRQHIRRRTCGQMHYEPAEKGSAARKRLVDRKIFGLCAAVVFPVAQGIRLDAHDRLLTTRTL